MTWLEVRFEVLTRESVHDNEETVTMALRAISLDGVENSVPCFKH